MCYGAHCEFERPDGSCGKPWRMPCPDDEDAWEEYWDGWEWEQERRADEERDLGER